MNIVVDASVAVKWFILDDGAERDLHAATTILRGLRDQTDHAIQPPHWLAEVLGVVLRVRPRRTDAVIALLPLVGRTPPATIQIYARAATLAKRCRAHIFDTLYHAVALENSATLITADERYFRRARRERGIELLRNFVVSP